MRRHRALSNAGSVAQRDVLISPVWGTLAGIPNRGAARDRPDPRGAAARGLRPRMSQCTWSLSISRENPGAQKTPRRRDVSGLGSSFDPLRGAVRATAGKGAEEKVNVEIGRSPSGSGKTPFRRTTGAGPQESSIIRAMAQAA